MLMNIRGESISTSIVGNTYAPLIVSFTTTLLLNLPNR